jgi:hypothetical protein
MIFGPWPAHPHLSDYYPLWILIILFTRLHNTRAWQGDYFPDGWFSWTRRRSTALPPGAMDERELVLQHTAHLWAYYVLCSLISLGAVAYYSVGIVQKTLAPAMPFVMFYDLPLVFLSLPGAIAFWIEPDWLEESTREVAGSVEIAH